MALVKGTKVNRGYATVIEDDGVNYRDIAEIMSEMGFHMNHSSVRNYVLRVMKKFVEAINDGYELNVDSERLLEIAKMPSFQNAIASILHIIEDEKSSRNK